MMICFWCGDESITERYRRTICRGCADRAAKIWPKWANEHWRDEALWFASATEALWFASATNYRLRKLLSSYKEELMEFYSKHWDRILMARRFFGLYAGNDFVNIESKHDFDVGTDWGGDYVMRWPCDIGRHGPFSRVDLGVDRNE
jgi:hypothetical protein